VSLLLDTHVVIELGQGRAPTLALIELPGRARDEDQKIFPERRLPLAEFALRHPPIAGPEDGAEP